MGSLRDSDIGIGLPAPKFEADAVVDGNFSKVSLADYKGKYVVLFYYPHDFTFVCPTELIAFSDRIDEFHKINCAVVGMSCDSKFVHLQWINTPKKQGGLGPLQYPLAADCNHDISKAYGVYNAAGGNTFRGLFIIDGKGVLRQITINDMPVGRSVEETLRLVQAFQFTDEHGEVCPANWKPGSKSIKPTVAAAKEYFESTG